METARSIREAWPHDASIGVILGTGAAAVAEAFSPECRIGFGRLPHMARATAVGHPGRFVGGRIGQIGAAVLQGRVHLYEGYSPQDVQFPVHVLAALGVHALIVTNASGGLNPLYHCGDLVVIDDLIDLTGNRKQGTGNQRQLSSPLPLPLDEGGGRGVRVNGTQVVNGPETHLFKSQLTNEAYTKARRAGIPIHRGTYVGVLGPNYETRAEYRFLRRIGDVVGMSTVHEVRAARRLGMEVLGLSVVSNECCPDRLTKTTGESVVRAVESAADRLARLIVQVCSDL